MKSSEQQISCSSYNSKILSPHKIALKYLKRTDQLCRKAFLLSQRSLSATINSDKKHDKNAFKRMRSELKKQNETELAICDYCFSVKTGLKTRNFLKAPRRVYEYKNKTDYFYLSQMRANSIRIICLYYRNATEFEIINDRI
uniref:Uncharacterized protein n=1 Tax=Romanomermis culicivorax TaxID=13658 RepID=A0A915IBX5_ROMCU